MDTQDTEAVALLKQAVALLTAMQKDIADIARFSRDLEETQRRVQASNEAMRKFRPPFP